MSATQFVACVEREDVSSLVKLPGVGKKTAERLIVEMKDRLKGWTSHDLFTPYTDAAPADQVASAQAITDTRITSYNVCYTKLLRDCCVSNSVRFSLRSISPPLTTYLET